MRFKGKIPVTLIGGFLGAGKTTSVKRRVADGGPRYEVVVNEFGDTNAEGLGV